MQSQGRTGDGGPRKHKRQSCHFSLKPSLPQQADLFDALVDFSLLDNHPKLEKFLSEQPQGDKPTGLLLPLVWRGPQWRVKGFYQPALEPQFERKSDEAFEKMRKSKLDPLENEAIMCPKPASSFCHLCQEPFANYLKVKNDHNQHAEHPIHKRKMAQQHPLKSADQIILAYKELSKKEKVTRISAEIQESLHSDPSKIRIIDEENTLTPLRLGALKKNEQSKKFQIPKKIKSSSSHNVLLIS